MLTLKLFACRNTHCKVCSIYSNHLNCLSTLVQCNFRTVSKTMSVRLIEADIKQNSPGERNHNKKRKKQKLKRLAFIFWFPAVSKTARNTQLNAEVSFRSTINCTKCKHYLIDQCSRKVFSKSSTEVWIWSFIVFCGYFCFVYLCGLMTFVLCLENKYKHTIYLLSELSVFLMKYLF